MTQISTQEFLRRLAIEAPTNTQVTLQVAGTTREHPDDLATHALWKYEKGNADHGETLLARYQEGRLDCFALILAQKIKAGELSSVNIPQAHTFDNGNLAYTIGFLHALLGAPTGHRALTINELRRAMDHPFFLFHGHGWPNLPPLTIAARELHQVSA